MINCAPRRGLENDIKVRIKEIGFEGVEWIILAQNRQQWLWYYEHGNETLGSIMVGNFLINWTTISFSRIPFHGV